MLYMVIWYIFARIIATSTDVNPHYELSSENKGVILEFMIVQVWELQYLVDPPISLQMLAINWMI